MIKAREGCPRGLNEQLIAAQFLIRCWLIRCCLLRLLRFQRPYIIHNADYLRGAYRNTFPQFVHAAGLITARLFSMEIAPCSQIFLHRAQAVQPAEHSLRVAAPLSVEEQAT